MANVFQTDTRNLIIWSKIVGLVHWSYTFEAGLLIRNTINSTYYSCLEFMWIFVMLISTYSIYKKGFFFPRQYILIKYWLLVFIARLSENQIVKFINDIIEFDRKQLMLLRPTLMENPRAANKYMTLNKILIVLSIYFILYNTTRYYFLRPRAYDFSTIALLWFFEPNILEIVIVIGGCFYIRSVASRFCALNDAWKRLPQGLEEIPGEWTQSEITMSIECLRLLHADLCEIIKVFSLGYGMILLGYIMLSFISLLMFTFMYFSVNYPSFDLSFKSIIVWCFPLIHSYCQYSIFHMSIVVYASLTNEKKREIISYLRSYRISNLPFHTKLQIKMFMNQMPEFESNVMSAYGIFNINLHFVLTNLILLFSGILTLIQMKDHPTISSISKTVMVYFIKQYDFSSNRFKNVLAPNRRRFTIEHLKQIIIIQCNSF